MSELSAEKIAQRALELKLLDDRQVGALWAELGNRQASADDFVRLAVRHELLTNYQVERMLKGERGGFFYGACKVLYLVGTGTFSRVYRAVNTDTGDIVAVKVLRNRFSQDSKAIEQFVREGELGRRLRHPNIVPIFEVYSKGATHYLVMEFVEGRNLRDFIKTRRKLEPLEATRLVADIASGLSYAFVNSICHRDLKMTNVLVSSRGQPKLVDFGLASLGDAPDDDSLNPRTVDYAGLERATGVRKADPRSDIFFLGCIYYHLLTGRAPLAETKDRTQRLAKSRYLEIPPIHQVEPGLPHGVVAVVGKAMEPNPDRRYQTPAEMLVDLKTLAQRLQSDDGAAGAEPTPNSRGLGAEARRPERRGVVMVVESNVAWQDVLRAGLKRSGYRVLMTSDPNRAISQFLDSDKERLADCVLFSTSDLGEAALEGFNRFAALEKTQQVPAILLLGGEHGAWRDQARLAEHRIAIAMPTKLKQIRAALAQLLSDGRPQPLPQGPLATASPPEAQG